MCTRPCTLRSMAHFVREGERGLDFRVGDDDAVQGKEQLLGQPVTLAVMASSRASVLLACLPACTPAPCANHSEGGRVAFF